MELEKLARQLGAAIQQDKVYLDFEAARKANDADEELNALMGKIRLIQLSYQQEGIPGRVYTDYGKQKYAEI